MTKAMSIVLCFALLVMFFSCGDDSPKVSTSTFTADTVTGKVYTLKITDDTYAFLIDGELFSTGEATKTGDTFTLAPYEDLDKTFTVTVSGKKIISIEGEITPDLGGPALTPDTIKQIEPIAGVWTWATMDDSKTNAWKGVTGNGQSVFAPGGASRINNAVENPDSEGNYQPYKYPEADKPKDKDGNAIEVDVFNFTGVTKVSSAGRAQESGAQFPMVGWLAIPDEETLAKLKTAYGYSFWIRLNSATANNWTFLTAVETDFWPEEGFEYKHWFGNNPGDSGGSRINNFTSKLTVGTWYKITVVMDKNGGFNMDQDKWLYLYPPNERPSGDPKKPFNQDKAVNIQWQIPLQHQVGAGVKTREGGAYDVTNGEYSFNVDFYGLELLK